MNSSEVSSDADILVCCCAGDDGRRLYPGGGVHDDRSSAGQRCHPHAQSGTLTPLFLFAYTLIKPEFICLVQI